MVSLTEFMCICTLTLLFKPIFSQQFYDSTKCAVIAQVPGPNYLCNSKRFSCDTYVVYRAQDGLSDTLFHSLSVQQEPGRTPRFQQLSEVNYNKLGSSQEIIVPVTCSCLDGFSRSIVLHNASRSDSSYRVACEVYEGLVKMQALMEENRYLNYTDGNDSLVQVPIRCACPDVYDIGNDMICFSLEELRIATEDFSPDSAIGRAMYRGRIGGSYLAIEQITEEAGHRVVAILTKINHLNVVKLEGCCYGTKPYLVYEFVENGSLRDNLNNSKMATQLTWAIRMQIVRAKISGFRLAKPLICSEEKEEHNWNESVIVGSKGYLAPEYLTYGQASIKVDVYAFGVVLLELLSAKEAIENGNLLKDAY
ncbi:lysM domain receptor-like kinase 4 [Actinidia eriantha]|uniref:lysM domain receptor-like kinase 4 n=1 Tax=Actinidia eriantha TaxID=165200 RepID=UPI002589DCAC|nr:lysM domain receptor-like kinase 4 [Actinidia eriantha]